MIFVDASYWYAASVRRDSRSAEALRLGIRFADEQLLTTNHVLGETWTLLAARTRHSTALDFVTRLEQSRRVQIIHVGPKQEEAAWAWLRRRDERAYSFVDATSFAVMRDRGITRALAFDADFAAAGFELLTP